LISLYQSYFETKFDVLLFILSHHEPAVESTITGERATLTLSKAIVYKILTCDIGRGMSAYWAGGILV
jgi:hypothetical protein